MLKIIRISAFKDNYIWLLQRGSAALVVDPGDAKPVLKVLKQQGLNLSAILITHHHADHQGGIAELLAHYPAAVFGPATESITAITRRLSGGEKLHFADLRLDLEVIAVPGHTLGHLAYYGDGNLFCGDTLFAGGCGRLLGGTAAQLCDSLARLAALPDATQVYCAHEYTETNLRFARSVEPGNRLLQQRFDEVLRLRAKACSTVPSTLRVEKATNPFLRCASPEIIASVRLKNAQAQNELAVFSTLREWRNNF